VCIRNDHSVTSYTRSDRMAQEVTEWLSWENASDQENDSRYGQHSRNEFGQLVYASLPLFTKQYKLILAVKLGSKDDVFHDTLAPCLEFNRLSWHQAEGLVGV